MSNECLPFTAYLRRLALGWSAVTSTFAEAFWALQNPPSCSLAVLRHLTGRHRT